MHNPLKTTQTMPSSAENVMSQKLEANTNCSPNIAGQQPTDLNTGLPPTRYSGQPAGPRVRMDAGPYTEGQMTGSRTRGRNVAIGAAVLGGLAAGAYALYKQAQKSNAAGGNRAASNSIAGWLPNGEPVTIRKRRTVRAKSSQVYAEWRQLENLPNILTHLNSVEVIDQTRSRWCAKGPVGTEVCWFANITEDEPGRAISWQAEADADVPNSGRIVFSEKPNGDTLIEVRLTYQPPAGELGRAVAAAFGENPAQQIEDDLTNFKFAMEEKAGAEPIPTSSTSSAKS